VKNLFHPKKTHIQFLEGKKKHTKKNKMLEAQRRIPKAQRNTKKEKKKKKSTLKRKFT
jgi:hypothetical protein